MNAGRRQFECKWDTVQVGAKCRHGLRLPLRHDEAWLLQSGPLDKQLSGLRAQQGFQAPLVIGKRQRRHREALLAADVQRLAAAGKDADIRGGRQQGTHELRACLDQVFAIIQHQKQAT